MSVDATAILQSIAVGLIGWNLWMTHSLAIAVRVLQDRQDRKDKEDRLHHWPPIK